MIYLQPAVSGCYYIAFTVLVLLKVGSMQVHINIKVQNISLNGHHSEKHEYK